MKNARKNLVQKSSTSSLVCDSIRRLISANKQGGQFDDIYFSLIPYVIENFYIEKYGNKIGCYPDVVYHYTTYEAALNFLIANVSGSTLSEASHNGRPAFWLRGVDKMNDRNELRWGKSIMKSFFKDIGEDSPLYSHYKDNMNSACALSFTSRWDYIPMWAMYAGWGKGVILGVSTQHLLSIAPSSGVFGRVTYSKSEMRDLVYCVYNELCDHIDLGKNQEMYGMYGKYWLPCLQAFVKHNHFEHENEYRLFISGEADQIFFAKQQPFSFRAFDIQNHVNISNAALSIASNDRYVGKLSLPVKSISEQLSSSHWLTSVTFGRGLSLEQKAILETAWVRAGFSPTKRMSRTSLK